MSDKGVRKPVISQKTFRRELWSDHVFQSGVHTQAWVKESRKVSVWHRNADPPKTANLLEGELGCGEPAVASAGADRVNGASCSTNRRQLKSVAGRVLR